MSKPFDTYLNIMIAGRVPFRVDESTSPCAISAVTSR